MGSRTFNFQQGWQTWTVPDKVHSVHIVADGGGSVANGGAAANAGGHINGDRQVTPGQDLKILIGEQGDGTHGGDDQGGGNPTQGGGGAGGDGNNGRAGGSGGGATLVRANTTSGTLVCAAGGAGGNSGDGGGGGRGGAATGEGGSRGTSGSNSTGQATGGSQSQGGNQGTSSSGSSFNGTPASNGINDRGGHGGDPDENYGHGGGGGGGGYRSGGGGQASSKGYAPGGGGGGGSNYVGGLSGSNSLRGGGGTGHGQVVITWSDPPPDPGDGGGGGGPDPAPKQPPTMPTNVKVADKNASANMPTLATGSVKVQASTRDPDGKQVRIRVEFAKQMPADGDKPADQWPKNPREEVSDWVDTPKSGVAPCTVRLTDLSQDTRYEIRITAEDKDGRKNGWTGGSFWTNRSPFPPALALPADNATFNDNISSRTFTWHFKDPDTTDVQSAFEFRWRSLAGNGVAGDWETSGVRNTPQEQYVSNPSQFKGNTFYEWSVRTQDRQGKWGPWNSATIPKGSGSTTSYSFFVIGTTAAPIPVHPKGSDPGPGVDASSPFQFRWKFRDPSRGDNQVKADLRYRVLDENGDPVTEWIIVFGDPDPGRPGSDPTWSLPQGTFAYPGYRYEWQVRTYDAVGAEPSDWSDSARFVTVGTPGSGLPDLPPDDPNFTQGVLGCGEYRVFVYNQGGERIFGEVIPVSSLTFGRLRDDISGALVQTIGFGPDCGQMLRHVRSWMHELVIFRDQIRVWEGPITRITYTRDGVEFEAKDVMAYLYRRIMRQGFTDAYRFHDPTSPQHGRSVVERALLIAQNALSYHDPNVLPYLTPLMFANDAHQTRTVPDYAQTAWQQIDDLAANAGLDYVTVGRRIVFNDTHRPIGRLPEMRDGDFSEPPVVTEYGMQLATYSAVTNSNGLWGAVDKVTDRRRFFHLAGVDYPNPDFNDWYGPIEMLSSSYSESDDTDAMKEQAARNVAHRWPTPVIVRVPDNSTLSPDTAVGFQQLIPGVWIPLRSSGTLRTVEQWQKLDSITVTYERGQEQVAVVMSPAPNGGADPDTSADEAT